jgi:hypothetical protein
MIVGEGLTRLERESSPSSVNLKGTLNIAWKINDRLSINDISEKLGCY